MRRYQSLLRTDPAGVTREVILGPLLRQGESSALLCVTPLWPVPLTRVPVAFRRPLKLAGLSSAWQEAGPTELMGCGSMTWYSYHSDIFTLQIRPNASYSPPGKKQIGWRRERLPTSVFWPGEFHGYEYPGSAGAGPRQFTRDLLQSIDLSIWFCLPL